jgi:hypothetical protein
VECTRWVFWEMSRRSAGGWVRTVSAALWMRCRARSCIMVAVRVLARTSWLLRGVLQRIQQARLH